MKNTLYILAECLIITFFSCTKTATDETIIFIGDQKIPNITEFIPDSLLRAFGNVNLNFGDMPPLLDRQFIANDKDHDDQMEIIYSNNDYFPIGSLSPNIVFKHMFYAQHNAIAKYHFMTYGQESHADTVYIIGNAPYFTAYFKETRINSTNPNQSKCKLAAVISGEVGNEGIINYRYGYIIENYEDQNNNGLPVGTILVYKETDTIAYYKDWFNEDSILVNQAKYYPTGKFQNDHSLKGLKE
jgi:hypothetical protein